MNKGPKNMEAEARKRLKNTTSFLKANSRRIIIIIAAAIIGQLAGVPVPSSAYPGGYIYPASFLPLVFIAGGGGLAGLVGYSIGATASDLIRFGLSLTLILFNLCAFGFAGWLTGVAMKSRTGIGQVILTLIATTIAGAIIIFTSPIGANIGRGQDYDTLYTQYLYGWLPFFIIIPTILSYWMSRVRELLSRFVQASPPQKSSEAE